jgi:integrase
VFLVSSLRGLARYGLRGGAVPDTEGGNYVVGGRGQVNFERVARHKRCGTGARPRARAVPSGAKQLPERWLASRHKRPSNLVFCNRDGRGLDYRHTGAAFTTAVNRAGITAAGRLSLHSLRHAYASLLIAQGLNSFSCRASWGTPTRTSLSASTRTSTRAPTTPPLRALLSTRAMERWSRERVR